MFQIAALNNAVILCIIFESHSHSELAWLFSEKLFGVLIHSGQIGGIGNKLLL